MEKQIFRQAQDKKFQKALRPPASGSGQAKRKGFQKGVSLYFVVITIMVMLSSITVLSNILYIRTKMIKDAGDSVIAFYAADSGIEKSLYHKTIGTLPTFDPENGEYYTMDTNNIFLTESNPFYGYKTTYLSPGGVSIRTLIAVGKYSKIKRGIIVKW